MVSPSGTWGTGSAKVRAGRRQTVGREPELVTWPLATFPNALRARISRCRVARRLPFLSERGRREQARASSDWTSTGPSPRRWPGKTAGSDGSVASTCGAICWMLSPQGCRQATSWSSRPRAEVIMPHVKRVVIANPKQVRIIAHAKIKTDTIDAGVLAQLYASGFLPEVWIPDAPTQALRRQVTRRNQIVRQKSRLKNIIQSILHCHLIPSCPHADLCGTKGRAWLAEQIVPDDEHLAIDRHMREFDRLGDDLRVIERDLARSALADGGVKRLMTIPGVDMIVALAITAAIGDVSRFDRPQKLVSYLGLNPSVRQSGPGPAYHGRITKQGRGHARGMLVEAAWAAARAPGPLRAFFLRVRARRGSHRAQTGRPHLASPVQRRRLRMGKAFTARQKAARC